MAFVAFDPPNIFFAALHLNGKPLLVAPIAQTQHCFCFILRCCRRSTGGRAVFFLELWGFSKHHFWGTKYIWVFQGVNSKLVFFENHVTVFFPLELEFQRNELKQKIQQILDLPSTQDATSSWICDSSMRMEKVPSKNLLPNGGRLDGDLHPRVKKYKNHQQKPNPSFVAPRFFQLNLENLQTHQPVHHPCSKRVAVACLFNLSLGFPMGSGYILKTWRQQMPFGDLDLHNISPWNFRHLTLGSTHIFRFPWRNQTFFWLDILEF